MGITRNRLLRCALAFSLISVIPALADLEAGKRAYEQRDYTTALKELKRLAEQGNAEAQVIHQTQQRLGLRVSLFCEPLQFLERGCVVALFIGALAGFQICQGRNN